MQKERELRAVLPENLALARSLAHKAVQFVTKAARANLSAAPDDSHSNLGWAPAIRAFLSQSLVGSDGQYYIGVSLSPLKLLILREEASYAEMKLENVSVSKAEDWLDSKLVEIGLKPCSNVELPYQLPAPVENVSDLILEGEVDALSTLSAWFDFSHHVLTEFAKSNEELSPGPSPVRCWPHHFDIATYVGLEDGDFETAKGIGVGMSPGDESYDQPYFYINPWPALDAGRLPVAPVPGHWHTDGFVGAIATAKEALSLSDMSTQIPQFINRSFSIGREKLGV